MKNLIYLLFLLLAVACQPAAEQKETAAADAKPAGAPDALRNAFEEVNVTKMHLYATEETAPDTAAYPFVGTPLTGDLAQYLDADLQPGETGVFGTYLIENTQFFILRVPGKYVSGDLALAGWDASASGGKLKKVADLAHRWCDEGVCHQQDAWLIDLDDNRKLELVTRSQSTENGKLTEQKFEVMTEDGQGGFVKTDEALASLAVEKYYVMMEKK
ncbi:MAG: hypothetical protein AAB316_11385 [Bacteroidota bacterium]